MLIPVDIAKMAWSLSVRGRIDSLTGKIINQNNEAPPIIVIKANLIIGAIDNKLGEGWYILKGGVCRGDQITFSINRTL